MFIRKLTPENWLTVDPAGSSFLSVSHEDGTISQTSGEEWLVHIMKPTLSMSVPLEIRRMFEIARGSMPYGHFFYPLYSLAAEQLYRIGEAAVTQRYEELNGPKKIRYDDVKGKTKYRRPLFVDRIAWLREEKHISKSDLEDWTIIRDGRNHFSHPESASICPPAAVVGFLQKMTAAINKLFE